MTQGWMSYRYFKSLKSFTFLVDPCNIFTSKDTERKFRTPDYTRVFKSKVC